jgi:hypothetical protein
MTGPGASTRGTDHTCHATGCTVSVPPAMFMHRAHWFALPKYLRDAVWDAYVPGQEIRKNPTREYIAAARAAIRFIEQQEGR